MTRISNHHQLAEAIRDLEAKSAMQEAAIREQLELVVESAKPRNILRAAFQAIGSSEDLKNTAINTALGLGTGIITKKLFVGRSANIFKRIAGNVIEFAVANFVRKKAPVIREKISGLGENHK